MATQLEGVFIHEKAICDSQQIGSGTRIWGFSHILSKARVGKNCNVCEQVFIENEVVIGDGCTIKSHVALWDKISLEDSVFIGPSVVFTNDLRPRAFLKRGTAHLLPTLIRKGATLGANSVVVCGVTVGEYALVGAGTVVTRDVAPHALVVGNPGKQIGRVCYCGSNLSSDGYCADCRLNLLDNSALKVIQRFS